MPFGGGLGASLVVQSVKNPPVMQETRVRSLGQKDPPLEKGMATHPSILACRIPWTEEPGRLQPLGLPRVRHDSATKQQLVLKNQCHLHIDYLLIL